MLYKFTARCRLGLLLITVTAIAAFSVSVVWAEQLMPVSLLVIHPCNMHWQLSQALFYANEFISDKETDLELYYFPHEELQRITKQIQSSYLRMHYGFSFSPQACPPASFGHNGAHASHFMTLRPFYCPCPHGGGEAV